MDTIMMGLICGGVVLIVPLVALIKASGTAKELYDLKQKVQRLQDRLNDLSDQFADTESVPRPLGQSERPTETKQAALAKPELIREGAEKFGSQCIVVSVDAKKTGDGRWGVFSHGGRKETGLDAVEWSARAVELGAGEIVLNSIDADGTKAGYDLEITRRISESVDVPVVASGGAGCLEHMAEVLHEGRADAVLAASIFHFGEYTVADVKAFLKQDGIPVRTI